MHTPEQNQRRHDLEPSGKGVVFFLTLPVVFLVLVYLSLACEDPDRAGTTDVRSTPRQTTSSTAGVQPTSTSPSETSRAPERPRPPRPSDSDGSDEGTTTVAGPVSYETAETAYLEGRYSEAATLFESYTERRPENPWGHYMLGLSAWKAGDLVPAEAGLRETVRIAPEHRKGWVNLARVLLDDGRVTEARKAVSRALEIEPERSDALRVLGLVEQEAGNTDDAVHAYRRALLTDPEDSWSMNNLGLIRIRQGDFEAALPPLARAVRLRDDVAVFHNNLGVALERTGRFSAAAESYRTAEELPGGHETAASSLARIEDLDEPAGLEPVDLAALADEFIRTIDEWRQDRMAEAEPGPGPVAESPDAEEPLQDEGVESGGDAAAEEVETWPEEIPEEEESATSADTTGHRAGAPLSTS